MKCKKKIFLPILVCVFDVITNEITLVERPRNYHILTTDKQTNKQTYKQTNKQTNYFVKKVSNISHSASGKYNVSICQSYSPMGEIVI